MVNKVITGEFDILAKTMYGLEDILMEELKELGAKDVVPGRRMVAFKGDMKMLYKANYHLRTALKILKPIAQFEATNPDDLYQYLTDNIKWDEYLNNRNTFKVETVAYSEGFTHTKFVEYRVKDAIVDFFNDHSDRRPNVSVADPDVLFHVHISDTTVTLALDSSGDSLHKRGYRQGQNDAPISEVLAAGILLRAGWSGQSDFLDPMCGSGTFLTEAAMIALGIPPGMFRKEFAFERWNNFDAELFGDVQEEWEEKSFEYKIYGSDNHPKAIAISRGNVQSAGITKYVDLKVKAFEEYTLENRPASEGLIVMNPPYGDRMRPNDLEKLYSTIGTTLKHVFTGWKAWVISGNLEEGFNAIGLKHFQREKLYNGMIECELRGYEMFEGKRSDHLEELSDKGLLPSIEEREQYYREREAMKREQQAFRMNSRRSRQDNRNDYRRDSRGGFNSLDRREGLGQDHRERRFDNRNNRRDLPKEDTRFRAREEGEGRRPIMSSRRRIDREPIRFTPRANHERKPGEETSTE